MNHFLFFLFFLCWFIIGIISNYLIVKIVKDEITISDLIFIVCLFVLAPASIIVLIFILYINSNLSKKINRFLDKKIKWL